MSYLDQDRVVDVVVVAAVVQILSRERLNRIDYAASRSVLEACKLREEPGRCSLRNLNYALQRNTQIHCASSAVTVSPCNG